MDKVTRRNFLKNTCKATLAIPIANTNLLHLFHTDNATDKLPVHLFSKHLQFLDWKGAAEAAAEMGFVGLDLTVRPGGHVLPENVKDDLPKAMADIKASGSNCSLITTAVTDKNNPMDMDVLQTAAKLGISHYRSNWFSYDEAIPMENTLERYQKKIGELSKVNSDLGLVGCYQNHAGSLIGASLWEVEQLLQSVDPKYFGVQYDIRHATVEGGLSWQNGLRLIHHRIKTIVIKDFKWEMVNGKWTTVNTPIGEGMVDFGTYFSLLKKYRINVPVILHLEYPLGGAENGSTRISIDKKTVFMAMEKDLKTVQELWGKA